MKKLHYRIVKRIIRRVEPGQRYYPYQLASHLFAALWYYSSCRNIRDAWIEMRAWGLVASVRSIPSVSVADVDVCCIRFLDGGAILKHQETISIKAITR